MISGRTATVRQRIWGARDSFGNDVESYSDGVDVDNVLVGPGACADLDPSRPEGVKVALTLHFPKTWSGDLRGAKISLTGEYGGEYRVVGSPHPYISENTPTSWHMPVEVECVDG